MITECHLDFTGMDKIYTYEYNLHQELINQIKTRGIAELALYVITTRQQLSDRVASTHFTRELNYIFIS